MRNFLYRIFGVDDWIVFYVSLENINDDYLGTLYHIEYSKIRNIFKLKEVRGHNTNQFASMMSNTIELNYHLLLGKDIEYIINNFIFDKSNLSGK